MKTITYTDLRARLAEIIDQVNSNHKPVIITRQNGKPAVLMSVEDFSAYEETAYLMRSPKNAARLEKSIAEIAAGQGKAHDLIESTRTKTEPRGNTRMPLKRVLTAAKQHSEKPATRKKGVRA